MTQKMEPGVRLDFAENAWEARAKRLQEQCDALVTANGNIWKELNRLMKKCDELQQKCEHLEKVVSEQAITLSLE